MDYCGNWKALQYNAKNAFENILISSVKEKNDVKTFIINDTFDTVKGNLKLKVIDFYGKEIESNSLKIEVLENSSKEFHSFSMKNIDKKATVLIAEFNNQTSYFYFVKPKELNLPKDEIDKQIIKLKNRFSITLKSTVLQKDVFLFTNKKGHFSDNFFDLLPNETRTIYFKTSANSLDDLEIKTLNFINNAIIPKKTGI
jgi:beta-mannosidase